MDSIRIVPITSVKKAYKVMSVVNATFKIKKLNGEQVKAVKKEISSGTIYNKLSETVWNQANTINFTVTQYFRTEDEWNGDVELIYTHFDSTDLHINYKDSRVFATSYFTYDDFGRKYRRNPDGSFTYVEESSYNSGKDMIYNNLQQNEDYWDYDKENLWTDCRPELSFEDSNAYIDISGNHSSWTIRTQFMYTEGNIHFTVYP